MEHAPSPVRLRLNGNALVDNWRALAKLSGRATTGAAVKADGYGLGAREVVKRLSKAGCQDFFVAHWAEAAAIADIVPPGQISVLNGVNEGDVAFAMQLGAIPMLNTPGQIARWKAGGGGRCHVMLDSGINRLGIGPEQMDAAVFDGLDIDILASHLASADEDVPQNSEQLARWMTMTATVKCARKSLANSAGIMLGSKYHFDLTRPGLSLYGGIARPEMADIIKPVVHLSAQILQVRQLSAGDAVGYGATHICNHPSALATAAIGYADGYLRNFADTGTVFIGDVALAVIGRVSMDLITIDSSPFPSLAEGDWVTLPYDLPVLAAKFGLSQYVLLTMLGDRFDRHWT